MPAKPVVWAQIRLERDLFNRKLDFNAHIFHSPDMINKNTHDPVYSYKTRVFRNLLG